MTISVTKSVSTSFLAVGLVAIAASALAAGPPRGSLDPVVKVQFADLNTSSPEGSRILYGRIAEAARAVCSRGADWYPSAHWSQLECYRATLDQTVAKLNFPALSAVYVASMHRTGKGFLVSSR